MSIEHPQEQFEALAHQLLEEADARAVEDHLEGCTSCREEYGMVERLAHAVAAGATRYHLNSGAKARLTSQVGITAAPSRTRVWAFGGLAAAAVVLLALGALMLRKPAPTFGGDVSLILNESVADYRRLLLDAEPNTAPSTDFAGVKAWMERALDQPTPVKFVDNPEFRLAGGRLSYLAGRNVGVYLYRYREGDKLVALFIFPAQGLVFPVQASGKPKVATRWQGLSTLAWHRDDIIFSLVADLPESDVDTLWRNVR